MFVEHKEAGEVSEAPAKTLKMSEAIRIGARYRPQAFGSLTDGFGTCALGAAIEGIFGPWSVMTSGGRTCQHLDAIYGERYRAVKNVGGFGIVNLNDELKWSREQIADWLEAEGL
jgi:hypothetical protein